MTFPSVAVGDTPRCTSSSRSRQRIVALLLALSMAMVTAPPASAASAAVGFSELKLGIKSSFRSYITSIAAGTITASDGAQEDGSGSAPPYLWSGDGGSYDPETKAGTIRLNGTVTFEAPAHTIWNITISDPTVVLDGDGSGTLLVDIDFATGGTEADPAEEGSATDVEFADLTVGSPTGTDPYAFSNVAATLTAAGSEAFGGQYAAGTALDPLSFTLTTGGPPTVSISDATITEGDSWSKNATFTVSLLQARPSTVAVRYATANGTAVAPTDYTAKAPTTLSFAAGQTSKTITIPVRGDVVDEADETFTVTLSNAAGITIGDGVGTATISDDDPPVPSISVGDVSLTEGNSGSTYAVFTVSLSNAAKSTVSVKYATGDGTAVASGDYTRRAPTTLSFSKGQTSKQVAVQVKADALGEPTETFSLLLSSPVQATIADGQAAATIVNDDAPAPEVSVADVSIAEGSGFTKSLVFTVQLSAPAQGTTSVRYRTANGTAVAPGDFTAKSATSLSFSKGQTRKTISVTVRSDKVDEPNETFQLLVSDPSAGLSIADGSATATIVDDD